MTAPTPLPQAKPTSDVQTPTRLGRNDPTLQELWAVKAAMNAAAGHQVDKIIERTRRFDLAATLDRLKREAAGQ